MLYQHKHTETFASNFEQNQAEIDRNMTYKKSSKPNLQITFYNTFCIVKIVVVKLLFIQKIKNAMKYNVSFTGVKKQTKTCFLNNITRK